MGVVHSMIVLVFESIYNMVYPSRVLEIDCWDICHKDGIGRCRSFIPSSSSSSSQELCWNIVYPNVVIQYDEIIMILCDKKDSLNIYECFYYKIPKFSYTKCGSIPWYCLLHMKFYDDLFHYGFYAQQGKFPDEYTSQVIEKKLRKKDFGRFNLWSKADACFVEKLEFVMNIFRIKNEALDFRFYDRNVYCDDEAFVFV